MAIFQKHQYSHLEANHHNAFTLTNKYVVGEVGHRVTAFENINNLVTSHLFNMLARLVLNSLPQVIHSPQPPKVLGLQA